MGGRGGAAPTRLEGLPTPLPDPRLCRRLSEEAPRGSLPPKTPRPCTPLHPPPSDPLPSETPVSVRPTGSSLWNLRGPTNDPHQGTPPLTPPLKGSLYLPVVVLPDLNPSGVPSLAPPRALLLPSDSMTPVSCPVSFGPLPRLFPPAQGPLLRLRPPFSSGPRFSSTSAQGSGPARHPCSETRSGIFGAYTVMRRSDRFSYMSSVSGSFSRHHRSNPGAPGGSSGGYTPAAAMSSCRYGCFRFCHFSHCLFRSHGHAWSFPAGTWRVMCRRCLVRCGSGSLCKWRNLGQCNGYLRSRVTRTSRRWNDRLHRRSVSVCPASPKRGGGCPRP